jgi:hypothetical protein
MSEETNNKENQEKPKPKSITSNSLRPAMPKVENNEERLKQEQPIEHKEEKPE